jgi:hypothetical protein
MCGELLAERALVGVGWARSRIVKSEMSVNDANSVVGYSFSTNGGATFTTIPVSQNGRVMTTSSVGFVSVFASAFSSDSF